MRLFLSVLVALLGSSYAQQSLETVIHQGRISTGHRDDFDDNTFPPGVGIGAGSVGVGVGSIGTGNPCHPSPCGPNTRCEVNQRNVALCRCIDDYVPDGHTINGCKPQCVRDTDCPDDHRCRGSKCVRVCVRGACAHNAVCRSRNHVAVCECPENYVGNGNSICSPKVPDDVVYPPAPPRNPCDDEPCGINANCKVKDDRAVCSCPFGYEGNPLLNCIKGQCVEHEDCPDYQVCKGLRCIDPCSMDVCGVGAVCEARNHQPVCSCPRGYVGNALERCRQFHSSELCTPSPCGKNTNCQVKNDRAVCSCFENYIGNPLTGCRPECVTDPDCPHNMACRNSICINPCRDACGENAYCDVRNSRAVCSCPQYFQGDPYSRCYAECTEHDHCSPTKACLKLQCVDPCEGACGRDANCNVKNHKPICSCPKTHTGDPFRSCRPFTTADYCDPNPCGTNANCQPGTDRSGNDRAVCTCPVRYVGNPLISCELGDCERNDECPKNQACYQYKCRTPCYTLDGESVCGEQAYCKVVNHMPVCSCPDGYDGNPLESCYIDHNDRRRGSFIVGRSK